MIDLRKIEGIYLYQGITEMRRGTTPCLDHDGEVGHAPPSVRVLWQGQ